MMNKLFGMPLLTANDREDEQPDVWCDECQAWHPVPRDYEQWRQIGCLAPYAAWLTAQATPTMHEADSRTDF